MSATLLLGKPLVQQLQQQVSNALSNVDGKLYTVGFDDERWLQYASSLSKSSEKYGIVCQNVTANNDVPASEFNQLVQDVCARQDCLGVVLQQPLPKKYANAVNYVDVSKDVDCVNALSVANMYLGGGGFCPATPLAVIKLLQYYNVNLQGANVVIIGRGNAVGKPLALLALQQNATVTICHTKTVNLAQICKRADVIVSACGVAGLVTPDFVNSNSVVVDVGLSFVGDSYSGDVDKRVYDVCKAVSPVPGGVGPVTRAMIFSNLMTALSK